MGQLLLFLLLALVLLILLGGGLYWIGSRLMDSVGFLQTIKIILGAVIVILVGRLIGRSLVLLAGTNPVPDSEAGSDSTEHGEQNKAASTTRRDDPRQRVASAARDLMIGLAFWVVTVAVFGSTP